MTNEPAKIDEIRELVRARFAGLTRGVGEFRETYLMNAGKFSGVRFEMGLFQATWDLTAVEIPVFREQQQILLLNVSSASTSDRRAA